MGQRGAAVPEDGSLREPGFEPAFPRWDGDTKMMFVFSDWAQGWIGEGVAFCVP